MSIYILKDDRPCGTSVIRYISVHSSNSRMSLSKKLWMIKSAFLREIESLHAYVVVSLVILLLLKTVKSKKFNWSVIWISSTGSCLNQNWYSTRKETIVVLMVWHCAKNGKTCKEQEEKEDKEEGYNVASEIPSPPACVAGVWYSDRHPHRLQLLQPGSC